MILDYSLTENDYLQFHLYESHKETKKYIFKFVPIYSSFFLLLAFLFYSCDQKYFSAFFLFLFLGVILIVPIRLKDAFLNKHIKYVKVNYVKLFDVNLRLDVNTEFIEVTTENSNFRCVTTSCDRIVETKLGFYLFIGLNFIIIPKRLITSEDVKNELLKISAAHSIPFLDDSLWR